MAPGVPAFKWPAWPKGVSRPTTGTPPGCLLAENRAGARARTTMAFAILFLLFILTTGWWLHHRWSALRSAQEARREAEMLYVFEARSKAQQPAAPTQPSPPSDFYPTLPGHG
jgi:endonuclease/exonuclease/phosphatase (EEP) superfamily protein YafD